MVGKIVKSCKLEGGVNCLEWGNCGYNQIDVVVGNCLSLSVLHFVQYQHFFSVNHHQIISDFGHKVTGSNFWKKIFTLHSWTKMGLKLKKVIYKIIKPNRTQNTLRILYNSEAFFFFLLNGLFLGPNWTVLPFFDTFSIVSNYFS